MATHPDPELSRLVADARAAERKALEDLAARARLDDLRRRLATAGADEDVVQLAVRIPAPLREAVRETARLAGTSAQGWIAQVLMDAVERATDPSAAAAAHLADEVRGRWRAALDADAYAQSIAATADADLANV